MFCMPAQWTAEVIGQMHLRNITQIQLAAKLGYTPEYVNAVLRGKRNPKNAEATFREAVEALTEQTQEST